MKNKQTKNEMRITASGQGTAWCRAVSAAQTLKCYWGLGGRFSLGGCSSGILG